MSFSPAPTRRTVLRTAAWATPAVMLATAAPAFATSTLEACTVTHTIDWGALNDDGTPVYGVPPRVVGTNVTSTEWTVPAVPKVTGGTWDAAASLVPVTLTIDTTMLPNAGTLTASDSTGNGIGNGHFNYVDLNQTSTPADHDLRVGRALKFGTTKATAGASDMRITLTFSEPVKNLSFTITDIDSNNSNQLDHVWIDSINGGTPNFTQQVTSVTSGNQTRSFTGTGVNTSVETRWRGTAGADNSSVRGNVRVTAAGPADGIHTVVIRFGNHHSNTNQRQNTINIGNISFETTETICMPTPA